MTLRLNYLLQGEPKPPKVSSMPAFTTARSYQSVWKLTAQENSCCAADCRIESPLSSSEGWKLCGSHQDQQVVVAKGRGAAKELPNGDNTCHEDIPAPGTLQVSASQSCYCPAPQERQNNYALLGKSTKNPGKTTQLIVHPGRTCSSLQPSWHLSTRGNGEARLTDTSLCAGWSWVILQRGSSLAPENSRLMANHPVGQLNERTLIGKIQSIFFWGVFWTWCPQVGHHGELAFCLWRAMP